MKLPSGSSSGDQYEAKWIFVLRSKGAALLDLEELCACVIVPAGHS